MESKERKEEVVSNEYIVKSGFPMIYVVRNQIYINLDFKSTRSTTLLSIIDFYWTEHIERMSYIREN
jgi:preprotein translocase subunit SecA